MSIFLKSYNLVSDAPKPISWEDYERKVLEDYNILLEKKRDDEKIFQDFFEKNPAMLPGAFGFFGESGHAPYNNALITQPVLQGLTTKIPDFLWFASDSLNIYPVFIEIEAPGKKWFNKDGTQTAKFTQAQNQIQEWKIWFSNPTHQSLFFEYYDIDKYLIEGKSIKPFYVLIYGLREEFEDNPYLNQKRAQLNKHDEIYMTFNRLKPNIKGRDIITCHVKNRNYYAKYVSPTFRLGPVFAEQLSRIKKKEYAILNTDLTDERKEFLISRLKYWEDFGKKERKGLINTGDWE
ncbi:DUF4263 domain-containing protein [Caldibacillus thermolactis]|uniref:DUF4263 domain-containing protein n=1 Tax=Pallidibacillus thermolactis TaxID=251051 RepID=A0ABT2WAW9_9BACI|nr:DUF4263 domain-containing protein [Pallidibacillus thermolactis]MCU9592833.1 DUF4263 domain-containing protein [Pallidibacillus thermolactis]